MRTQVLGAVVCAHGLAGMAAAEEIWHETAKLISSVPIEDASFGSAVVIAGDLLLVGAPGDQETGVVYVIEPESGVELGMLQADDGEPGDSFGLDIAVSGSLLVVGAPYHDSTGTDSGAAYIFDLSNGRQLAKLLIDEGAPYDYFGAHVAIDGERIVAGSPGADTDGVFDSGAAHIFDTASGERTAVLSSPQPDVSGWFGRAVAVRGETVVVGAPGEDTDGEFSAGAAYLFDAARGRIVATLTADQPDYFAHFGFDVAVGPDHVLIGAPLDDLGDPTYPPYGPDYGATYVFDRASASLLGRLEAAQPIMDEAVGRAVAIDGSTVVLGSGWMPWGEQSAYLFDLESGEQIVRIEPSLVSDASWFGRAVTIDGDVAVVGAPLDDGVGAAFVFSLLDCPPSIFQSSILINDDNSSTNVFGHAVALDGPRALVGGSFGEVAYLFDTTTGEQLHVLPSAPLGGFYLGDVALNEFAAVVGGPSDEHDGVPSGAVRVFDPDTGALLTTLAADDGLPGDALGAAVAISGTTIIAGAPGRPGGAAYLFDALTGAQLAALDPGVIGPSEHFGVSVDIDGNAAVVGVAIDSDGEPAVGGAYLFDVPSGRLIAELVVDGLEPGDRFGYDVAVGNGRALVGAPWADQGAAYVFDAATGALVVTLEACEGLPYDWFGWQVDMAGECAILSAPRNDDDGNGSGCAYIFDVATGEQLVKLEPTEGNAPHFGFGWAVAIDTGQALVGDHLLDVIGSLSGIAYLFDLDATCPADLDGDGAVGVPDLIAVILAWGTPAGDVTGDGQTDAEDLDAVLSAWGTCE